MTELDTRSKGGWITISSEIVHKNPWYKVQKDDVILPDGKKGEYFSIRFGKGVYIVPVRNNKIIFIKQYRYIFDNWFLELPAGGVGRNSVIKAARKELKEETGYKAGKMKEVGKFYSANGLMKEEVYVFIARDLQFVGQELEATEGGTKIIEININDAYKMIEDGKIIDGQTIAALTLAKKYIFKK